MEALPSSLAALEQAAAAHGTAAAAAERVASGGGSGHTPADGACSSAGAAVDTAAAGGHAAGDAAADEGSDDAEAKDLEKRLRAEAQLSSLDALMHRTKTYVDFLAAEEAAAIAAEEGRAAVSEEAAAVGEGGGIAAAVAAGRAGGGSGAAGASAEQPKLLRGGQLRQHQRVGLKWLIRQYERGLNSLLADDMGLGKTVQTLAFLAHLLEKRVCGPFLIVSPVSMLYSWEAECKRWLPSLPTVVYHGPRAVRKTIRQTLMDAETLSAEETATQRPAFITSYSLAVADVRHLRAIRWKVVVMDEAHLLKSRVSRRFHSLVSITADARVMLTGTPLQNSLNELWSLLNLLVPEVFDDADMMTDAWLELLMRRMDDKRTADVVEALHVILKPFMLRRTKALILADLPPLTEILLHAPMTERQQQLYRAIQKEEGSVSMMNKVMQLRKCCNSARFVRMRQRGDAAAAAAAAAAPTLMQQLHHSGKLQLLARMLPLLIERGHRTLLFSQMTRMLDELELMLDAIGIHYLRLDGSTPGSERAKLVTQFAVEEHIPCFLISTRAGGLGLNFSCADTVVLMDSDWNPSMDLQAMDRAHRIGQRRHVYVYRLHTPGSVEDVILKRAAEKSRLSELVVAAHCRGKQQDSAAALADSAAASSEEAKSEEDHAGPMTDDELLAVMSREAGLPRQGRAYVVRRAAVGPAGT
eukprot:PLAT258.1.p1 GENE.PLAT258.1~~PLAT258.1.p1  ORF type:complete len:723 (-),score=240.29 PLAT258.1:72-2165(-)